MSKKVQSFQNVSAAINLDSSGDHEAAFRKYVECLHSLSTYLTEQCMECGCSTQNEAQKKEAKQVLSVICDCADRANSILKLEGSQKQSPVIMKKSIASPDRDEVFSRKTSSSKVSPSDSLSQSEPYGLLRDSIPVSSTSSITHHSKSPVFVQMDKDNALLFKKYQKRMEYVKDKYSRQNLELELQRAIAENLMIAQSKQAQMLKQQQEERKANIEATMKRLALAAPCADKEEQEKRDLYIEVLKHETKIVEGKSDLACEKLGFTTNELVEAIFQRTLRCSNHPLMQWLIMVQLKLKSQVSQLFSDFSYCVPLLEDPNAAKDPNVTATVYSHSNEAKRKELHKSIEDIAEVIRNTIDTSIEILYAVYKEQLSGESEVLAYKLVEFLLITPLWPLIIGVVRIANLESELRVAENIQNFKNEVQKEVQKRCTRGLLSDVTPEEEELYAYCVYQLKKVPSFFSLTEKLSLLVHVSQTICERTVNKENLLGTERKLLGADDLVPVLSHILIESGMPVLASEFQTLELLIHPKYMLGEEGYALTSFQTALNYLEMKKLICPFDVSDAPSEGDVDDSPNNPVEVKPPDSENLKML